MSTDKNYYGIHSHNDYYWYGTIHIMSDYSKSATLNAITSTIRMCENYTTDVLRPSVATA